MRSPLRSDNDGAASAVEAVGSYLYVVTEQRARVVLRPSASSSAVASVCRRLTASSRPTPDPAALALQRVQREGAEAIRRRDEADVEGGTS